MTEQQEPIFGSPEQGNLVPPKPTGGEQPFAPQEISSPMQQYSLPQTYSTEQQYQQPMQQPYKQPYQQPMQAQQQPEGNPLAYIDTSKVYPTPAPEQELTPAQQYYQTAVQPYQQVQQPYQQVQQPYQQVQQPYQQTFQPQQPYQQQVQGQTVQPAEPVLPYQTPVQPPQAGAPYQAPVQPSQPVPQYQPYQQGGQNVQYPMSQQPVAPQPYYQQQWQPEAVQLAQSSRFGLYLVLGILAFFFCGGPFAIPAIVYAFMMKSAYNQGNAELFISRKKTCRIWLIVSFGVGMLINILFALAIFSS